MEKVYSLEELDTAVSWLISQSGGYRVWLLEGQLGAGKTTLTAAVLRQLNSRDEASSPTFSIINEYRLDENGLNIAKVYHYDLYRMKDTEEIIDTGFMDMLEDHDALHIIEWPGRAAGILPEKTLTLTLETLDAVTRKLNITYTN